MKPLNDKFLWDMIDRLRDELNIASDGIMDLNDVIKDLKAENENLHNKIDGLKSSDDVRKLRICRLKNDKLKAELENYNCGCKYPKELKADAEEYFSHNPQDEKIWYMLISPSDVDEDGVLDAHKDVGVDAIAEFENYEGRVSGDVFK